MNVLNRETVTGLVLGAIGLYFVLGALDYGLGSSRRLGPGYFPLIVGSCLIAVSAILVGLSVRAGAAEGRIAWRPLLCVGAGIVAFAVLAPRFGLVPAVAVSTFAAAFGDREATVLRSLALAAAVCAGVVAIFHFGLGVPIPLYRMPG